MTLVKDKEIKRGGVYFLIPDPKSTNEVNKANIAVVISNDFQNESSSKVIIIPVISSADKAYPFEVKFKLKNDNDKECKALTDQMKTVDKTRIGDYLYKLKHEEMKSLNAALRVTLDLE